MKPAKHVKTGNVYFILDECVTDATNSNPDRNNCYVLYVNKDGRRFVRERSEFFEKFEVLLDTRPELKTSCTGCKGCVVFTNSHKETSEI
jgi:hypothetical protein